MLDFVLMIWTHRQRHEDFIGLAAGWCRTCDEVQPFDVSCIVETRPFRRPTIEERRKRCWNCGQLFGRREKEFDRVIPTEKANSWTLSQLLEETNQNLVSELREDRIVIVDRRVSDCGPILAKRKVRPVSRRHAFSKVPWQLFATLFVGMWVLVYGIHAKEGNFAQVNRDLPGIYGALIAATAVCALFKRLLAPKVAAPTAEPDETGTPKLSSSIRSNRRWWALFLLLVIGGAASLSAGTVREINGWPRNDNVETVVITPGDRVKIHLPQQIISVDGLWMATGTAELLNPPAAVQNPLPMETSTEPWPGKIQVAQHLGDEGYADLWVISRIPPTDALRGQTIRLRVRLAVSYPKLAGYKQFVNAKSDIMTEIDLKIAADPDASQSYQQFTWIGYYISLFVGGASSLLLSYLDIRRIMAKIS